MSIFWENFNSNGKARQQAIGDLRESLAEICEGFALHHALPRWQRRQVLLTELKKLADYYRQSTVWEELKKEEKQQERMRDEG
ncbi:MAG: hypothetical protein ACK4RK_14305 [Gemmataceae bacterium]